MRALVSVVRHPLGWLARLLCDLEINGREHIPHGAYVVAANHMSFIDPVLVTLVAGRNVRYLAAAELFDKHPLFQRLITFFGAIPTHKDRPVVAAIRAALDELDTGRPVGVFPEGRRVTHWGEEPPQRGAAWLALFTGVPLVPVAIVGADGTLSHRKPRFGRSTIRVWVQPAIDATDYLDHADPIAAISRAWATSMGARLELWSDLAPGADGPG
ncbi:MAG: 1-acyl-sn-glycerol-3-phosphate acyltransferase [Acidimicrobiia bacterium]|nr:1-acyl-sn-glycerol-3-phosphate acyltransferase [Acidimicrobiia bacterium]